jgi:hypothetical protein
MDNVPVFREFHAKVLMAQSGDAMRWARAICHHKHSRVVKVNNQLVLYVANLGL